MIDISFDSPLIITCLKSKERCLSIVEFVIKKIFLAVSVQCEKIATVMFFYLIFSLIFFLSYLKKLFVYNYRNVIES